MVAVQAYRGFQILTDARPASDGGWHPRPQLIRGSDIRPIESTERFDSKDVAIEKSLVLARRAIDGYATEKAWQEFRATYAAARLFALLLEDLDTVAPDYVGHLRTRLNEGIAVGEGYVEDDPTSDGPALVPTAGGGEPTMMDLSDARCLEDQLFPDRHPHDPRDFHQIARGLSLVAFRSCLENLARALGATARRKSLPDTIVAFLSQQGLDHQLPPPIVEALRELDESRHLMVHDRGIVTDRYLRKVKDTALEEGELRSLSVEDLSSYAETTWTVARALVAATRRPAA